MRACCKARFLSFLGREEKKLFHQVEVFLSPFSLARCDISPLSLSLPMSLSVFPFPVSRFLIPLSLSGDMRQQQRRLTLTYLRSAGLDS